MNLERAAMKGKLAEAEQKLISLKKKGEALCSFMRQALNVSLTAVEDIDIGQAAQMFDELVMTIAEISGLKTEIAKLERELR